jgi:hypothetical protein
VNNKTENNSNNDPYILILNIIKDLILIVLRDHCTCHIPLKQFMFVFIESNKNEHETNKKQQNKIKTIIVLFQETGSGGVKKGLFYFILKSFFSPPPKSILTRVDPYIFYGNIYIN